MLSLGEYRESLDVDFLCATREGYRMVREVAWERGLAGFFPGEVPRALRELRADRYGVRNIVEIDGIPVKLEINHEDRIPLQGAMKREWGVPVLCATDMYAEKLLANADRYADVSTASRDIIDLAMLIHAWGDIPPAAWDKTRAAYGEAAVSAYHAAVGMVAQGQHLAACLRTMHMDERLLEPIRIALGIAAA